MEKPVNPVAHNLMPHESQLYWGKSLSITFHHHAECNEELEKWIIGKSLQTFICFIYNMPVVSASAPVVNCAL